MGADVVSESFESLELSEEEVIVMSEAESVSGSDPDPDSDA